MKSATRPEFNALALLGREESIESQTQKVIGQSAQKGIGVEKAGEASPTNFLLQLLHIKRIRVKQRRRRTSRDVVAQEREDIDQDWQTKRNDEGSGAGICQCRSSHARCKTHGPRNS